VETSFYSQNTLRFYPFDEEQVQSNRSSFSEIEINVLQKGIVDLGIVLYTSNDDISPAEVMASLRQVSDGYKVTVIISEGEEFHPLEFIIPKNTLDFTTIKSVAGSDLYGFITIGHAALLGCLPIEGSQTPEFTDIPVYIGCVKILNKRKINSIEILNQDRFLPSNKCLPDPTENRPSFWSYGSITLGDVIFKEGYNCLITFLPLENRIVLMPLAGAGLGQVKTPIGKGYFDGNFEPFNPPDSNRFDGIEAGKIFAKTVAGAYGNHIVLTHDNNFIAEVTPLDQCEPQTLTITCIGDIRGECEEPPVPPVPPCE